MDELDSALMGDDVLIRAMAEAQRKLDSVDNT